MLQGDGTHGIGDRVGGGLDEAIHPTDWYHAREHVWEWGRTLYGEGAEATKAALKAIEKLLCEGPWRLLMSEVLEERKQHRSPAKREALQSLATSLSHPGDRLAYDRFREMGRQIGSGAVESACQHVVGLRLKRGGMRWSIESSQAILSLRSAGLNGEGDVLWAEHPLAA